MLAYLRGIRLLVGLLLIALKSYGSPYWVSFIEDFPEGSLPEYSVIESDSSHTIIEVVTPGMWVEDVTINGYNFQGLSMPDTM